MEVLNYGFGLMNYEIFLNKNNHNLKLIKNHPLFNNTY